MSGFALAASSLALLGLGWGSIRAARAAAVPWGLPAFGVPTVALGLFVTGLLVPICLVGRLVGRFDAGLGAAAMVGVVFAGFASRWVPTEGVRARSGTRWWFAAVLALVVGVYGYVSFHYQMHDEHAVFGHKSMVEQLRRDVYPVYYPSKPGEEARYHYGFDVLAGVAARGFGVSSDHAIDLVCLLMVVFMTFGAAAIACDEDAERSAPLAALAIHFGAGLAWLLLMGVDGRHPRCLTQFHHPSCGVELFPTPFLNVFQHPVSVGVPMFLLMVLLLPRFVTRWTGMGGRVRLGLGLAALLLLAATSIAQFVYYALGALAVLAAAPFVAWGRGKAALQGLGILLGVCLGSLGLAYLLGGMLAYNPSIDPKLVGLRPTLGFPEEAGLGAILYHHIVNLGVGLLAIPVFAVVGLRSRRAGVLTLLAFVVGGILVAQLFVYTRSWDIVKFPSAAAFGLSLLYVIVIDRGLARLRYPLTLLRHGGAVLLMGSGALAALFVVRPLEPPHRLYEPGQWRADSVVAQAIEWWRAHDYRSEQVIFAQANVAQELSVFGGLSVVAQDADLYYMGVHLRELYRQRRLGHRIRAVMDPKALQALGVEYVTLSSEELDNLGALARKALENSERFEVVAQFSGTRPGQLRRIWKVKRTSPVPAPAPLAPLAPGRGATLSVPDGAPIKTLAVSPEAKKSGTVSSSPAAAGGAGREAEPR